MGESKVKQDFLAVVVEGAVRGKARGKSTFL